MCVCGAADIIRRAIIQDFNKARPRGSLRWHVGAGPHNEPGASATKDGVIDLGLPPLLATATGTQSSEERAFELDETAIEAAQGMREVTVPWHHEGQEFVLDDRGPSADVDGMWAEWNLGQRPVSSDIAAEPPWWEKYSLPMLPISATAGSADEQQRLRGGGGCPAVPLRSIATYEGRGVWRATLRGNDWRHNPTVERVSAATMPCSPSATTDVPALAALATPEKRAELAAGVIQLSLCFARTVALATDHDLGIAGDLFLETLRTRTSLLRVLGVRDVDASIATALRSLFLATVYSTRAKQPHHGGKQEAAVTPSAESDAQWVAFEAEGFQQLWQLAQRRVIELGPSETAITYYQDAAHRPYECWSYDYDDVPPFAGVQASVYRGQLNIHIDNVYTPASPLGRQFTRFAASLLHMLQDRRAAQPEITTVVCDSWLCSLPRFLKLFPPECA